MNNKNFNLKISLLAAIVYITIMGIGMYIMHSIMGDTYGTPGMMNTMIWVEVVLSLLAIIFISRYSSWKAVGFGQLQWKHILWLVPGIILLAYTWFNIINVLAAPEIDDKIFNALVIIGITTLMVGFSEEVMFRGIVLRGALTQKRIFTSMLISAAFFSSLHAVNVLGGASAASIPIQLLNTFLFGLFFAPLALKMGNLIPLIIFHWLWDFTLFTAVMLSVDTSIMFISFLLIEIIMIIVLWWLMKNKTVEHVSLT